MSAVSLLSELPLASDLSHSTDQPITHTTKKLFKGVGLGGWWLIYGLSQWQTCLVEVKHK